MEAKSSASPLTNTNEIYYWASLCFESASFWERLHLSRGVPLCWVTALLGSRSTYCECLSILHACFGLEKTRLFPLLCLAIGYKFILITFQFHPKNEEAEGLKVLSYNAHLFNYKNPPTGAEDPTVFPGSMNNPLTSKSFRNFTKTLQLRTRMR